jgi:TIR domain
VHLVENVRPKIFISYAREDEAVARQIAAGLAQARVEAWIDVERIGWGDSFLRRMNEGLAAASYVVLLLSPASAASEWVEREWMAALAARGTVLLPVMVADTPVPPLLRDLVYVDLRHDPQEGLRKIIGFFVEEHAPVGGPETATRAGTGQLHPLRRASRRAIRLVAQSCLKDDHFLAFLHDQSIPEGQIAGGSLNEKLTRLLADLHAAGISDEFVDWVLTEPDPLLRRCIDQRTKEFDRT